MNESLCRIWCWPCLVMLCAGTIGSAAESHQPGSVAKCVSAPGALLHHVKGEWLPVKTGDELGAGGLLVALPQGELLSANGAVQLRMIVDVTQRGPFPVLETAVELKSDSKDDLDVRLERGIIVLSNHKEKGAATVRLEVAGKVWHLTLTEPETRVGMEIYGRHPPGLPLIIKGQFPPPMTSVVLLQLKGKTVLVADGKEYALEATPGPTRIRWDNVSNLFEVEHLKQLPDSLKPLNEKEKQMLAQVSTAAATIKTDKLRPSLEKLLHSDKKTERLLAVTAAGALDELGLVFEALNDAKHADARDHAVVVLRHWMGREPGQVAKLADTLAKEAKLSKVQAKTIVQLLFGFSTEDQLKPATYEVLINSLGHKTLAVRQLAYWNLIRLVPEGKTFAYDPAAGAADRKKAVEQWRQLIPEGKLPQVDKQ